MTNLIKKAAKNVSDILRDALQVKNTEHVVVIFDQQAPLTRILTDAYRNALPTGRFIDFDTVNAEDILAMIKGLQPKDAVILVQSSNFRLNKFRIRIELFQRELKTIEHIHLARMSEDQFETYIDSLAYDPTYYRPLGHSLKAILDQAQKTTVECDGTKLTFDGPMENAKMNIGDYAGMKNVGGTFPIGEVFTEAKNLKTVNGEVKIFSYAGEDHMIRIVPPFTAIVEEGILRAPDAPEEFQRILDLIRADEPVYVREFGLSLNPAMSKHRIVNDITAFERQLGLHLSLGAKHAMYPKPGLKRKEGRYHVDVFVDVTRILVNDKPMYADGAFIV
jgi:hypothetical protein